jgi:flagellin-like protein
MLERKAEIGIGTLIIFIAMILVAAIAAGVLIQTAGSLQNKALMTGERTKTQISTAISPTMIYAEDGTDGSVDDFFVTVKLAPGSDQIDLTQMLVSLSLKDKKADLVYVAGLCNNYTGYSTNSGKGSGNFTVQYLINGTENSVGKLVTGDVIKLCMKSPRAVSSDEDVKVGLVPKTGTSNMIEFLTPDVVSVKRLLLYP